MQGGEGLSGTGRDTGNVRTCIGLEDCMSHDDVDNKEDAELEAVL